MRLPIQETVLNRLQHFSKLRNKGIINFCRLVKFALPTNDNFSCLKLAESPNVQSIDTFIGITLNFVFSYISLISIEPNSTKICYFFTKNFQFPNRLLKKYKNKILKNIVISIFFFNFDSFVIQHIAKIKFIKCKLKFSR